jgi:hypothetical protein
VQIGIQEAAERLLREFGAGAEAECDARAARAMPHDMAVAKGWWRTKQHIQALRPAGLSLARTGLR